MKYKEFDLPIFGSNVAVIEATFKTPNAEDTKKISDILESRGFTDEHLAEVIGNIGDGMYDGGALFSHSGNDAYTIIIYYQMTKKARINTIAHEKRHLEDAILSKKSVTDLETAGYIAGYLAEEMLI